VFLVSLERSRSVDIVNGLALVIWTSAPQVMGKRRAGSQTGNLTPDHKKPGIDFFPTSELRVRHGVGKISTRATTLVHTSSRLDSEVGSYERSKSRDSNRDSFGTPSWESREKKPFGCIALAERWREYYMGEGGGFPRVRAVVSLVCQSARGLSQHPRVFPNVN
jgi:hypothetical protein